MIPAIIVLAALIFAGWFIKKIAEKRETPTWGELRRERINFMNNEQENTEQERQTAIRGSFKEGETPYDRIHYCMAYRLIPYMISMGGESGYRFDDTSNWMAFAFLHAGELTKEDVRQFPWPEIEFAVYGVNDDWRLYAYTFPTPRRHPQAKYGAIVLDSENRVQGYLTLERSYRSEDRDVECNTPERNKNVLWALGETMRKKEDGTHLHLNYGGTDKELSLDDFLQTAVEFLCAPFEERMNRAYGMSVTDDKTIAVFDVVDGKMIPRE